MIEFIKELYSETFYLPPVINYSIFIYGTIEILTFSVIFLYLPVHILMNEKGSKKFLSFMFLLCFWLLKVFYFPLFISLNPQFSPEVPKTLEVGSTLVLFFGYIFFGMIPLLISVLYYLKFWYNKKDTSDFITVDIIMPIYNETHEDLSEAIKSLLAQDYPGKINIYCSFDDIQVSGLYYSVVKRFVSNKQTEEIVNKRVIVSKNADRNRCLICVRNEHGGKKSAQNGAWKIIEKYGSNTESMILLVDSDITARKDCVTNFVKYMNNNKKVGAATGVIGLKDQTFWNFLHHYQMPEYIMGQIITRSTESFLGGITCCPGALTMIRKDTLRKVSCYFDDTDTNKLLDYHRFHLGEDRYLTDLLLRETKCGLVLNAYVETVGITNWFTFLKQRRRWLLGAISNEGWMISSFDLWRKYPAMLFFKSMEFCNRFLSVYSLVYMVRYLTVETESKYTPYIYFAPIFFQMLLLTLWGIKYKKYSIGIAYFFLIPIMPFVQTIVYVYSIITFRKKSWGGPRTSLYGGSYRQTMDLYV